MNWLSKLSFRTRMLGIVGVACLICAAASLGLSMYFNEKDREAGIITKSLTIHSRLEAATAFVATQGGLKIAIERFTQKYKDPKEMSPEDKLDVLNQVPIFAAMKIGAKDSEKEHYRFRIFSDEPRKKENLATPEELKIFKEFEANPALTHKIEKTGKLISVYRPVRLAESQGCLYCHGDPSNSPWKNGQDVLGFKMENWKDGKLHGVFAIISDKEEIVKAEAALTTISNTTMLALMIGVAALISLFLAAFLLRKPIEAISQVASILSGVSNAVLSASTQIADSAENLSQAATEQAASIEETSASIEEISAMVKKTSENAIDTANTSKASETKAQHGSEVVEKMTASMREIDESNNNIMEQVKQSNAQMAEIVKVIHEIGGKTKVINDIVFQTKLLSFNASVEAARAGEHGKGFAVVAEEVGNLAQMSGNASKEISSMLEGSIGKVESIARETQTKVEQLIAEGKSKVDLGVNVAHECGEVLKEIVANVGDASRLANEISTASGEQATGVAEIAKAMIQLSQVTHENTATAQASAGSAEQLSEQAKALQASVHSLLETIHGANEEMATTAQTPTAPTPSRKKDNVVPIKRASAPSSTPVASPRTAYQKVAGDPSIPDANDPAFEDV